MKVITFILFAVLLLLSGCSVVTGGLGGSAPLEECRYRTFSSTIVSC